MLTGPAHTQQQRGNEVSSTHMLGDQAAGIEGVVPTGSGSCPLWGTAGLCPPLPGCCCPKDDQVSAQLFSELRTRGSPDRGIPNNRRWTSPARHNGDCLPFDQRSPVTLRLRRAGQRRGIPDASIWGAAGWEVAPAGCLFRQDQYLGAWWQAGAAYKLGQGPCRRGPNCVQLVRAPFCGPRWRTTDHLAPAKA